MKKIAVSFIVVLVLLFSTSCSFNNDIATINDRTYILEQPGADAVVFPKVIISDDNISFQYDLLSSYLPAGVYTIEDDILTMTTNDKLNKYVFQVDGDKLIFQKNQSSDVKLIDDKFGVKITDNAVFTLEGK